MSLASLAERVYYLFAEDNASPRHDNLHVSLYSHSECEYAAYSTRDGFKDDSPFAGTCKGVFAVIQSSIMQLALEWPALTMVNIVPSIRESLGMLEDTNLIISFEDSALIVWDTLATDLLVRCEQVRNDMCLAKAASYDNSLHLPNQHAFGCVPYNDTHAWDAKSTLGPLSGLDSVQEPFLGGIADPLLQEASSDPYFYSILLQQEPVHISQSGEILVPTDQKNLWNIPCPDSYIGSDALSSITLTPSSSSDASLLASSSSPFSPPLSQTQSPQSSPAYVSCTFLQPLAVPSTPIITACPRDICRDYNLEQSESQGTYDMRIEQSIIPDVVLSPKLESVAYTMLEFTRSASSSRASATLSPTEGQSVRKPRRIATKSRTFPYRRPSNRSLSPTQSWSQIGSSNSLGGASPSSGRSEDDTSDGEGERSQAQRHRLQKRRKAVKKRFRCGFCSESFTRDADVDRHLKSCTKNPDRETRKRCNYCSKNLPVRDDAKERHWKSAFCLSEANRRGIEYGSLPYW